MLRVDEAADLIPVLGQVVRVAVTVPQLEQLRDAALVAAAQTASLSNSPHEPQRSQARFQGMPAHLQQSPPAQAALSPWLSRSDGGVGDAALAAGVQAGAEASAERKPSIGLLGKVSRTTHTVVSTSKPQDAENLDVQKGGGSTQAPDA